MASVNRPNAPQDYRTPKALLDAIKRRFGRIDWDAACTRENAVTDAGYYFPEIDALARDWNELGTLLVFANPPWSDAGKFATKCAARTVGPTLLLVQAAVDSEWYARHVHGRALVLALRPRIPFLAPDGKSPAFVDARGKALGVNRPAMLACYSIGSVGFEPWDWR